MFLHIFFFPGDVYDSFILDCVLIENYELLFCSLSSLYIPYANVIKGRMRVPWCNTANEIHRFLTVS